MPPRRERLSPGRPEMAKNIVLLCDGTSNEISKNRTSILRLYGTLAKDEG